MLKTIEIGSGLSLVLVVLLFASCSMVTNYQDNKAKTEKYAACMQYSKDQSFCEKKQ